MSEGFSGAFFGALPPEIAEQLQNQRDLALMERRDFQNRLRALLDSLTPEHIVTLREVLNAISVGAERLAPYLEGQLTAMLHYKFEVCVCCGGPRHDDVEVLLTKETAPPAEGEQMELEFPSEELPPQMEAERIAGLMEQYNVRFPREGEVLATPEEKPVICNGCGTLYQSLEDRMVKRAGVEGCDGCLHKNKWG